jgi:hypothetical protein
MGTMESDGTVGRPSRAEADADAWMMEDERDDYAPATTLAEAHAHWHAVHGATAVCDLDCGASEVYHEPEPEAGEGIRCAHCKGRHWTVADVKACAAQFAAQRARDSQWSWDYQRRWGRAENE